MPHPIRFTRLAARALASNHRRLGFPYKLNFAVTDLCNSRCRTCNIWRKPVENELSTDEIREFFRKSNRFSWIDVTGGEIFLRRDLLEIFRAILENCRELLLLHFPTNGILTEKIVEQTRRILEMRPPQLVVTVSLDGPPALNDEIRGVPGDWTRAVETFRRLRELSRVDAFLGMTLSAYNYGRFQEAFDSVKREIPDLVPGEFHLNIMHTSAHFYANTDSPALDRDRVLEDLRSYRRHRASYRSVFGLLEKAYQGGVPRFLETGRSPLPCLSLSASCYLGPRGDVYPCSIWDRPLGNIRDVDYDLERIWSAPETLEARRAVIEERCPGCWTPCEAYQTIAGNLRRLPPLLRHDAREG